MELRIDREAVTRLVQERVPARRVAPEPAPVDTSMAAAYAAFTDELGRMRDSFMETLRAVVSRPQEAPVVNVHLPEPQVSLEAHIETPEIRVDVPVSVEVPEGPRGTRVVTLPDGREVSIHEGRTVTFSDGSTATIREE